MSHTCSTVREWVRRLLNMQRCCVQLQGAGALLQQQAHLDVASKISREQEAVGTEYLVDRIDVPALLVSQVGLQVERLRFKSSKSLLE